MVAAPFASAAPVVNLRAPFSGTTFANNTTYAQGCGSNSFAHGPYFNPTNGQAHVNQGSVATPCGSPPVLTIYQAVSNIGINSSTFSPSQNLPHAHVKVHWYLTYTYDLSATLGNSSQTTYASYTIHVFATVYDKTTGITHYPSNSFTNSTTISDVNGSALANVNHQPAELFLNMTLWPTHTYVFNTSVRVVTTVDTIGPGSSAFAYVFFWDPPYLDAATLTYVQS